MFEILNELNFLSFFLCLHCASHFYTENATKIFNWKDFDRLSS